jgi:hypothetical protein
MDLLAVHTAYKPCDVFIHMYVYIYIYIYIYVCVCVCVCVYHCLIYWVVAFDTRIIMPPSFPITSEQDKCRYQFPITAVECFREWNQTALLKSPFAVPDLIMLSLWHSGKYRRMCTVHHLIYCISFTQCAFRTIVWIYSVYFPGQH